ncbi:hypothetical protein EDB84DRAFT_1272161, partial [Lactarius hengduanensis]
NLSVRLICPDCRDPNPTIIEEFGAGDLVCGAVELVLGDCIVHIRSEWRVHLRKRQSDPSRVSAAAGPLMEGMEQLDTIIGFKDCSMGIACELQRAPMHLSEHLIAFTDVCSQNSHSERNLLSAFRDISSWCDQFSLPKAICDIAKQLYKRADEEKLLHGKPRCSISF